MIWFAVLAIFPFLQETSNCRDCKAVRERADDRDFLVFTSFSVPLESWIEHAAEMNKIGGVFVIRGMPSDSSFDEMMLKVVELKAKGVAAPIDIDPTAFEEYNCQAVPMFVLRDEEKWDKVTGNIPVHTALEKMAGSGDTKEKASQFHKRWKGS